MKHDLINYRLNVNNVRNIKGVCTLVTLHADGPVIRARDLFRYIHLAARQGIAAEEIRCI